MIKFYDTNILLHNLKEIKEDLFCISSITLQELESIKTSQRKDDEIKFKARQVTRYLKENQDKYEVIICTQNHYDILERLKLPIDNDNLIMACAYGASPNEAVKFYTNDLCCYNLAKSIFRLDTHMIKESADEKVYKGYELFEGNTEEVNSLFEQYNLGENILKLQENQYLIIKDLSTDNVYEYKYSLSKLNQVKLPPSKCIKALNEKQRCALDLLLDKNIPIKIVAGTYGSGKSLLATKMGVYHLKEKGTYSKMMLIRQPIGSGQEIGFLPGSKEEKIGDFYKPIIQHLEGGEIEFENMRRYGQIKMEIPYYMKGLDIQQTYMLVDEAEDLTKKDIKLIGSRISKGSCCVFVGDWKQAEGKYKSDNGLTQFIEYAKGNPLVGIIVMDEDVRSSASKVFADFE